MELFNKIKDLRSQAFKSGDKFLHSVLTNVFSDANPVGTEADQTPSNESVIAVVKKHLKGVVETIEALAKQEVTADVVALKNREKEILESLLPKQLSAQELMSELTSLLPRSLKDWMAHLKTNFAGLYDGKIAKQVFETAAAITPTTVAALLTEATTIGDTLAAPVQGVVEKNVSGAAQPATNSPVVETQEAKQ